MKEKCPVSVGTLMSMSFISDVRDQVKGRFDQVRLQAKTLRRAVDDLEAQSNAVLARLGLEQKKQEAKRDDVIDVGGSTSRLPQLAKRVVQAIAVGASFVLLGLAMLSLGIFAGAAALAYVVITKGLGLRIDVARPV